MRYRKILNSIVVFILLFSSIFLFFVDTGKSARNIYVKESYPYSNGDGSADRPYKSIQKALNEANDGDSIYVFEGTYNESFVIDKQVSLIGLDRDETIIDRINHAANYLVEVTANHVTIEDITFTDTSGSINVALIFSRGNYLTIEGANFSDSIVWGIYLYSSNDNTIGYNIMNGTKGIQAYYSNNNVFSNNVIRNSSEVGILLKYSDDSIVHNNTLYNNNRGVEAQYCNDLNISRNTIGQSSIEGIRIKGGNNAYLENNTITDCNGDGLYISSSNSKLIESTFGKNQIALHLLGSNCQIYSNLIRHSTQRGIFVESGSNTNTIYLNKLINNSINALDDGSNNQWYYGTQGNYWDDYNDGDRDNDGIGDSPYITGGGGQDLYPLGYFLSPPAKPSDPSPADGETGVGLSVTLSVTVSDPDSDNIKVYFYNAVDNSLLGHKTVSSGSTATYSFTQPFETTFFWYAIANDSILENTSNTWLFTTRDIPPTNEKPVADPGGPYFAEIGEPVTFEGNSTDPDGSIDFYRWNFGDGSSEILDESPTHSYSSEGVYTVTLTIVDNDGRSSTNQTTVTVGPVSANQPPVANVGGPYSGAVGETITFDGSGSTDDGTIQNYTWYFADGTFKYGASTTHSFSSAGTHYAQLTVTDDGGDSDTSQTTITISSSDSLSGIFGMDPLILVIIVVIIVVIIASVVIVLRRRSSSEYYGEEDYEEGSEEEYEEEPDGEDTYSEETLENDTYEGEPSQEENKEEYDKRKDSEEADGGI